jgi:hypothetical protein
MRRYQLVYLCLVLALLALVLIPSKHVRRASYPSPSAQQRRQQDALKNQHSRGLSYFSFNSPLFPASAIISLTDDNSTFFLSRPAAFGSALPDKGLSGRLWIGRGFGDEAEADADRADRLPADASALPQGELGCSDVPGWDESLAHVRAGVLPHIAPQDLEKIRKDLNDGENSSNFAAGKTDEAEKKPGSPPGDGTDDFLHEAIVDPRRAAEGDITGFNQNSDIQSIQEKAEIGGKVVLLSRGGCGFLEKVKWAQRRGGIAVIIGDNIPGGPLVTMYAKGDTTNVSIPALFTSYTTAHLLSSLMPPGGRSSTAFAKDSTHPEQHEMPSSRSAIGRVWDRLLFIFGFGGKSAAHKEDPNPGHAKVDKIQHKPRSGWFYKTPTHPGISGSAPGGIRSGSADATTALADELSTTRPDGLWVTLTPTSITTSPFIDTLLVLVVSPVVTLTVVYAMLLVRSRIRRRRWRAPKSVVERLPVRTYHTIPPSSGSSSASLTPTTSLAASAATPLLHAAGARVARQQRRPRSQTTPEAAAAAAPGLAASGILEDAAAEEGTSTFLTESESREKGLARWRRRYSTRQRECVVCLEEYIDGVSRVMSLPCGHEFHVECM